MMPKLILLIVTLVITAVITTVYLSQKDQSTSSTPVNIITYLPLGDSYTIGQSVKSGERWPNQLAERLRKDGVPVSIIGKPAVTGYTSQDLIDKELSVAIDKKPDFATVQIGVNDFVQGIPSNVFQRNLVYILDTLRSSVTKPSNIVLITIPDYSKTPVGSQFGDPEVASKGIANLNSIITAEAKARGLPVVDIFEISQQVSNDQSLTANDGLHPSGKQYSLWVDQIHPVVRTMLR